MKLTIRPQRRRGRIEWVLDVRKQGKRTRTFHPTKAAAESAAADIRDQWSVSGHSWATMPARERAEIVLVAEEIKQAGRTWREVWDFYRSAHPVGVPSLPLEEAIARFLEEKTAANRRPRYVEQMARFLRFFARGRERLPIGAVTREMLEQWVQGRRLRAGTQKNNYLLFGAFFSHALKRGWVARNPCRGIEHPRVERVPPRILAPAEARHLLGVCEARHPKLLAWVALGMFAGTRPEETDQLTWPKIDLARGLIQMDAAASKVRHRRVIPLEPAAVGWLTRARELEAQLPWEWEKRKHVQKCLRNSAGWERWWPDVLRHTAASYLMAIHRDAGKVAHTLGNSPGILLTHYHELVTPEQAAEFWAIRPNSMAGQPAQAAPAARP